MGQPIITSAQEAHWKGAEKPREQETRWVEICESAEFRGLMAAKARFLIPTILFSFIYYFALPLSVGYFPEIMNKQVFGSINLAYLFALSQFFVAWAVAFLYARVAENSFDRTVNRIKEKLRGRGNP
ncbi:DUF485 domain-containing protein [Heliobacterium gestii]|uniref:DUF485 domain-containing protein n=1 Tax=Heliomicrobium gestii TaxID=2699 RepID=A0A845L9V0_HELGE|nr:DUF485 domain-containing protein [Heliomicrobium gestii]MBM7866938.1 uncharacterized membrane protein (DUF485 family) [Heliomicrobium gestii]MZP42361.1 DUF485 domain-containing protein [Heliomicrobium gestii]